MFILYGHAHVVIQKILEIRGPTTKQFIREVGRVTERLVSNKGQCVACIGCIEESNCKVECGAIDDCLNKLAEYETAEEEGRLVVLPCKVGRTVYHILYTLAFGEIGDKAEKHYFIRETSFEYGMIDDLNETVFLTREEAEKALDKIEGDK